MKLALFFVLLVLLASSNITVFSAPLERWVARIEDLNGDQMRVETFDDAVWAQLVQLYHNGSERWVGGIVVTHENEWGFRFDPTTITVAEYTPEGHQSTIILISEDLDYWLGGIAYVWAKVVEIASTHDLSVMEVTPNKWIVQTSVNISVTVQNQGDFTETINVTAYYSNETITPEQWETFWSEGDVSRDGHVDSIDLGLWDDAWVSYPGDWNWNPDADLDQDGDVDFNDFTIISIGLGWDIWSYFNIIGGSIGNQPVNDLSASNSATMIFTWSTIGVPYGDYIISAKSIRVQGETDIANNNIDDGWVTVTIGGDCDGDADVDYDDLIILAGAYGSIIGQPAFDERADFDNDGDVDYDDLVILAGNYSMSF